MTDSPWATGGVEYTCTGFGSGGWGAHQAACCTTGAQTLLSATRTIHFSPSGYYAYWGCTAAIPCDPGHYSGSGNVPCNQCPAGKHQGSSGMTSCASCSAGYSSAAAATSCSACPTGRNLPSEGQAACSICSAGKYAGSAGTLICTGCPAGSGGAQNYAFGTPQTWITNPGSSQGEHDSVSDCTQEQAICTVNTFIAEMREPPFNCIGIRRGESCRVLCRNGWYFVGPHACGCSGSTCTLMGGSCQRCPELNACGGGNKHGDDGCDCYGDTGVGGCAILANRCYIDNACRADGVASFGTATYNTVAQQSDIHYSANVCKRCDTSNNA